MTPEELYFQNEPLVRWTIKKYYPDFKKRLYIDAKAGILDEKFHQQEGGVDGEMHHRISIEGEIVV